MKINWKVRFRNKAFLITFIPVVVAFVYQVLGMFDVVPTVTKDVVIQYFTLMINGLAMLGIVTDPTSKGICDGGECEEDDEG